MKPQALPHSALLRLTGWATPTEDGIQVGRLRVRTSWRPEGESQRVSLNAYPRTWANGKLQLETRPRLIRPPQGPNAERFTVTGQLLRVDRSLGEVRVKISPERARTAPFLITMNATTEVLESLNPEAFSVTLRGRVLHLPTPTLLAESAEVVHAPVPGRWAGHRGVRGYGKHIDRALQAQG